MQLLAAALNLTAEHRAAFVASVHQGKGAAPELPDDAVASPPPARPAAQALVETTTPTDIPLPAPLHMAPPPVPPTSVLGREHEEAAIVHLLQRGAVRLVTLTGPGGVGKTTLALRAADNLAASFPDGVCWIPLAALQPGADRLDHAAGGGRHRNRAGGHPRGTDRSAAGTARCSWCWTTANNCCPIDDRSQPPERLCRADDPGD